MKRRNLQNREIDAVAARLLKAGRLSGEEIDDIVSTPGLFDSVRKRSAACPPVTGQRRWIGWKPVTTAFASILALMSAFGYFAAYYEPESAPPLTRSRKLPNVYTVDETPASKQFIVPKQVSEPAATPTRPTLTKAVFREEARPVPPKPKKKQVPAEREFYPLSFAGNLESFRGGHIVRVDMTRSSLFALGVDLPLENDAKFIKTDVLVGTDGVPRAIRFVD